MSSLFSFKSIGLITALLLQASNTYVLFSNNIYQSISHTKEIHQPGLIAATTIKKLIQKQSLEKNLALKLTRQTSPTMRKKADLLLSLSHQEQNKLLANWITATLQRTHQEASSSNKKKKNTETNKVFKKNKETLTNIIQEIETNVLDKQNVHTSFLAFDKTRKQNLLNKITQTPQSKNDSVTDENLFDYSYSVGEADFNDDFISFNDLPEDVQLFILIAWLNSAWDFDDEEISEAGEEIILPYDYYQDELYQDLDQSPDYQNNADYQPVSDYQNNPDYQNVDDYQNVNDRIIDQTITSTNDSPVQSDISTNMADDSTPVVATTDIDQTITTTNDEAVQVAQPDIIANTTTDDNTPVIATIDTDSTITSTNDSSIQS